MRISKERAAENRAALLQAASRLFRRRGIDAVSVADIAAEAEQTYGALYSRFRTKSAVAAEAFSYGFEGTMAETRAWANGKCPSFEAFLERLLSTEMRDRLETGCPMTASASEIGRRDAALSTNFKRAFEEMVEMIEKTLEDTIPVSRKRRLAVAAVAAEIGAIAVSRAVEKADAGLSNEVLAAVREVGSVAHKAEKPGD